MNETNYIEKDAEDYRRYYEGGEQLKEKEKGGLHQSSMNISN